MAATYATLDDVRAQYPYRKISGSSSPTDAQVQGWLDEAQVRLDSTLREFGISVPITDSNSIPNLRQLIIDYAKGRVRDSYRTANGELDPGITGEDPLITKFETVIRAIQSDPSFLGAAVSGGADPTGTPSLRSFFSSHAGTDDDFEPTFTRRRGEGNF